jgi:hypothetical protein
MQEKCDEQVAWRSESWVEETSGAVKGAGLLKDDGLSRLMSHLPTSHQRNTRGSCQRSHAKFQGKSSYLEVQSDVQTQQLAQLLH